MMGIVTRKYSVQRHRVQHIAFGMENATEADVIMHEDRQRTRFYHADAGGISNQYRDRGGKMSGGSTPAHTALHGLFWKTTDTESREATSAWILRANACSGRYYTINADQTALVIAHRLSTIQHSDEIIVWKRRNHWTGKHNVRCFLKTGIQEAVYCAVFVWRLATICGSKKEPQIRRLKPDVMMDWKNLSLLRDQEICAIVYHNSICESAADCFLLPKKIYDLWWLFKCHTNFCDPPFLIWDKRK